MRGKFLKLIAVRFPWLPLKLKAAEINKSPEEFIKQAMMLSFMMAFAFFFIMLGMTTLFKLSMAVIIVICIAVFFLGFAYMLKLPDFRMLKVNRDVDREIIYAGRFLVIELQAGVPVYNALESAARNYKLLGKYLSKIINEVDFGTPLEVAISNMVAVTPSTNLRRVLWQILNSLKTGADVAMSLNAVIDQIIREQMIDVKEYARKLNPLAMFYMIMAIILPSIGIILLVILSVFMGFQMDLTGLLSLAGFFAFAQFMFYNIIRVQRPAVEL